MKARSLIVAGLAAFVSFVVGVNSGYALGADQMQCVTYHLLSTTDDGMGGEPLISEETADIACRNMEDWSKTNPTVLTQYTWVQMTDPAR